MTGDFSRFTFDRSRRARGVLMQQGRVQLDADWNELQEVQHYRVETETIDVVGPVGTPKLDDGFRIDLVGADELEISAGRIYIDGLLAENDTDDLKLSDQPYLPGYAMPAQPGLYLALADVFLRTRTALDDSTIREVALGGPDTATRETIAWQVKLLRLGEHDPTATCNGLGAIAALDRPQGTLRARAEFGTTGNDPCEIGPDARFRGVENQLYRVQIHQGGTFASATFKWSRDNASLVAERLPDNVGANKVKVGSVGRDGMPGFVQNQWVELLDDANELFDDTTTPLHDAFDPAGKPGTLIQIDAVDDQILTLKSAPPAPVGNNPKVRAWDMPAGAIQVNATTTSDGFIELESGVQVQFDSAATYVAGDYWLIPARTIIGDVEWPTTGGAPEAKEPDGIRHHYARLALVSTGDGLAWEVVDDCREIFPSLTAICAEDVCFDNANCAIPGAETVQDAIDALCERTDLKKHNKHLHGWGIVCGLQVECATSENQPGLVLINDGYAIDCEGNDIDLDQDETFDALKAAQDAGLLDQSGNGDIDLIIAGGAEGQPVFTIEQHDTSSETVRQLLDGTLIMDFVNDCLGPLQTFYEDQFTIPADGEKVPVGPIQQRVTTVSNLLVQIANPQSGSTVFISPREDAILRTFYADLKELLSSKTYCSMWDGAREFPEYPFPGTGMDTIFGKDFHHRIRIHPNGEVAYTIGNDEKIHVFDLQKREMVEVLEHPGGQGARVTDVAFSADGKRLFATALHGDDTVFAPATISGLKHTWLDHSIICETQLVTLGTHFEFSKFIYAIGEGQGLYLVNPDNVDTRPAANTTFAATGHFTIAGDSGAAFAIANTAGVFSVVELDLTAEGALSNTLLLPGVKTVFDILAIVDPGADANLLFVAGNDPTGPGSAIGFVQLENGRMTGTPEVVEITRVLTPLALGYAAAAGSVLISVADENRVLMHAIKAYVAGRPPTGQEIGSQPVQISPIDVELDARDTFAYVLNLGSNTITVIPAEMLKIGADLDLAILTAYRIGVLNALADLLGGLIQYFKDCFCHHLLVNCPECDEQDKIYLGCIHIRNFTVQNVCNFSKRKYVKSFMTLGYWLSIVPIIPLIDRAVELACCALMPELFGKYEAASASRDSDRISTENLQQGIALFDKVSIESMRSGVMSRLMGINPIASGYLEERAGEKPQARIEKSDVVDQPTDAAKKKLEDRGVIVDRVEPLDRSRGFKNIVAATTAPTHLPPGTRVTLIEEDGIVRYYATTRPADSAEIQTLQRTVGETQRSLLQREAELAEVRQNLDQVTRVQSELVAVVSPERLTEIEELRSSLDATRHELGVREQQFTALQETVDGLRSEIANAPARVASLEAELVELRDFRKTVNEFMNRRPPR